VGKKREGQTRKLLKEHHVRGEWFRRSAAVAAAAAKRAISFMDDFVDFWTNELWKRTEWKAAMGGETGATNKLCSAGADADRVRSIKSRGQRNSRLVCSA
jgi:hypothetical protein